MKTQPMSQNRLYHWTQTVTRNLPALNQPKQRNRAAFSLALARAQNGYLHALAEHLPELGKPDTVLRWLQRFLSQGPFPHAQAQPQLAHGVINTLPPCPRLTLLVDETALHDRLRVRAVCLAYHGRALPLAWEGYRPATYPEGGQVALVERLLKRIAPAIPHGQEVRGEADRGIGCSPALLRAITQQGWYYLVRVQNSVRLVLEDGQEVAFGAQVAQGQVWQAEVWAFKKAGWLRCRALGGWRSGSDEPWRLVTNHPAMAVSAYRVRMWEALAFRDFTSGGWGWQRSRVWLPSHAERLW